MCITTVLRFTHTACPIIKIVTRAVEQRTPIGPLPAFKPNSIDEPALFHRPTFQPAEAPAFLAQFKQIGERDAMRELMHSDCTTGRFEKSANGPMESPIDFTDKRDLFAISDVELGVEKRLVR